MSTEPEPEPASTHFGSFPPLQNIPGLRVRHTPAKELPPGWTFEAVEVPGTKPGRPPFVRYTVRYRGAPVMMVVMEEW